MSRGYRVVQVLAGVLLAAAVATGCGDDGDAGEQSGSGTQINAGTVDAPPQATGDAITLEQADAVSRSALVAWMAGDRERAEQFAADPAALDELFARSAPSSEFSGEGSGYCSRDEDTASHDSCSYSVVDDSDDGILAIATTLAVVDGRVVLTGAGFAGWND